MPTLLKTYVRYDAKGILVAGSGINAYSKPRGKGWILIPTNACCDGWPYTAANTGFNGFIKLDGAHNVIAGSLVIRKRPPKNGHWAVVPYKLCCND